jgi:hypothetical protein
VTASEVIAEHLAASPAGGCDRACALYADHERFEEA